MRREPRRSFHLWADTAGTPPPTALSMVFQSIHLIFKCTIYEFSALPPFSGPPYMEVF